MEHQTPSRLCFPWKFPETQSAQLLWTLCFPFCLPEKCMQAKPPGAGQVFAEFHHDVRPCKKNTHRCELAFVPVLVPVAVRASPAPSVVRGSSVVKRFFFSFLSTLKSPVPERRLKPRMTSKLGRPANRRLSSGAKSRRAWERSGGGARARSATSHTDDEDATQPTTQA